MASFWEFVVDQGVLRVTACRGVLDGFSDARLFAGVLVLVNYRVAGGEGQRWGKGTGVVGSGCEVHV
jgi:hypothetical protein